MILITLKPWESIPGITHVRTIWEVSDSENFLNILEKVESTDMLENYFSNLFIPVGATYYVRATRVFNNGSRTALDPIPTTNYGSDKSSMLLADDPIVEIPFVYVNKEDIMSNASTLRVTTSEFRCSADDHAYTHWIVLDGNDDILDCILYDKVNKTSIDLNNNYVYKNKSKLRFIAIHGTYTGAESPAGIKIVNLTTDFNFEINNGISWVEPLKDFKIVFTAIDKDKPMNIFKVELLDYATETLVHTPTRSGDTFLIPWVYLKEGIQYKLLIYAYDKNLIYSQVYKTLKVANTINTIVRDPNYEYIGKIEESASYNSRLPNNPIHSEALFNMEVLVPMLDKSVEIWNSDDITLKDSKGKATGLTLLSSTPTYTLIKPITKGLVLIDTPSATGVPTFLLYSYSNHNSVFTLENTLERTDETVCLGKTNAIVQTSSTEFIYLPVGSKVLRKLDISTNKVTDIIEIPAENTDNAILIRMGGSSILIANLEGYQTQIYNYEKNTFKDGITFGPATFIGAELRTMNLINGDTLIVKTKAIVDDTDVSCLVFHYKDISFDTSDGIRFSNNICPDITMSCGYGHGHMAKFIPGDPQQKIDDSFNVKVYV